MTITDIKVEGIDLKGLAGIEIIETAHAHGICELSFILAQKLDSANMLQLDKKKITVKAKDDIIFCGIVNRCEVVGQVIGRILVVTLLSLSCQMDLARKSKSYQSATKRCTDIAVDIENNYADAEFDLREDYQIADLVYRDNLTDWEFLKSVAERHGQILFVYTKTDKLKLSIGFKAFQKFPFISPPKLVSRNLPMDFFFRLEQNTYEDARSSYFLETTLELSDLTVGVGCSVKYDKQDQAVVASRIYIKDNNLYNEVTLRHAEGCCADAWDVMRHFDECYYLAAKVLEAHGNPDNAADNYIKVQFDCDENQDADEALKIPYESGVSNYLYTMPDKDDKVCVYVDKIRQAAIISLRTGDVEDEAENRSFKIQNAAMIFDPNKFSFTATENTELKHEAGGTHFNTDKNIVFFSDGNIIIQSAQGLVPDGQVVMVAPHMAGYEQYIGMLGQPSTVQFNPSGSSVGKEASQVKNSGAKADKVKLSDLVEELNKITGNKPEKPAEKNDGGGGGDDGNLKFDSQNSSLLKVQDSAIEMSGSDINIKARDLFQVAYVPLAGGGKGNGKIGGGEPKVRSVEEIEYDHGVEDRSHEKINEEPVDVDKKL